LNPTPIDDGSETLTLQHLDAPVAVCSPAGVLHASTNQAIELLERAAVLEGAPARLPRELCELL